jgi:hypothetical protein
MRNIYHSSLQQLIYQDHILQALTAATRPDKHWCLIAYPKSIASGQKTGFLHMNLNLNLLIVFSAVCGRLRLGEAARFRLPSMNLRGQHSALPKQPAEPADGVAQSETPL